MIYHETASFPPEERDEVGRRLRDAAFDWIYDLSMAHSRSQEEFVAFLRTYNRYRTRLIILLKLGFRVGLIRDHAYSTLEGDLMEQEKVVQHQIELLESGRGMHTGALTSRSAMRSQMLAGRGGRGRDDRGGDRDRGRDDRGARDDRAPRDERPPQRAERPDRGGRGLSSREFRDERPVREERAPREDRYPRDDRGPRDAGGREERPIRRASTREMDFEELTGAAYPEPAAAPTRGGRRGGRGAAAEPEPLADEPAPRARRGRGRAEEADEPAAPGPTRSVSTRSAGRGAAAAEPAAEPEGFGGARRAGTRSRAAAPVDDDFGDEDAGPVESGPPSKTPVRRRRRAAVAEATGTAEPEAPAPTRRGRR